MKLMQGVFAAALLVSIFAGCRSMTSPGGPERQATANRAEFSGVEVFKAAGTIAPTVDAFREALGALNANAPGSRLTGRREINWDAVPAAFTNTDDFPSNFFNQPAVGRARGTLFSTPGTGFRTSDNNFADLSPDFGRQFEFFSPIRTFAPVGSNLMTVSFFVPGTDSMGTSTGFGVVFSDVDRKGSASIRLFGHDGRTLGQYSAPPSPQGVSFVGVIFRDAVVASVEIVSGEATVSPDAVDVGDGVGERERGHDRADRHRGHARDLVIMDDFIYGEPRPALANDRIASR